MRKNNPSPQVKISKIQQTNEKLTGRTGIFFFLKYIENIDFYKFISNIFGKVKGNEKGLQFHQFIKQMLAFFIDGTYKSISSFDELKEAPSYAALLENTP